ncbi:MAG: aspartyl/glutamyl-tRNA amidotransferase subunit A [Candidatus Magasanikbacteria bacterium RIFOXYD2_FULL_39_9]|uniref:Glutamyl-tRNA(Gln) amidotransferase subunit A n=1 Tax=Candidatus Magasanikbacteria bacterium RIFOXYD1_FULL_40_23 TaxID=1798705 RepID=A0A1F6P7G3_9BACT|nr:MAG: aspartyl/glutamyl-tRNA amidotransferase subunit A [Candidatus Magasanikbacteria bacterium RIFOXYD1_FULL_40_23]OGH92178.1 MAG: aspartyl/glutamyl-tRNA amidotransferase subunit A [Candidatus Magasanikbacteria bacterium RIFOXYD2_FULL_39_9]
MQLNELTIKEAQEGLRSKKFTSVELTKVCLDRIKARNKDVNAFITVCEESALEEARVADGLLSSGQDSPLTGIPFSVKDAICTAGVRSTGSAKILDNYTPPYDATVIGKIRKQGGVLVGKNNCDAFGHGASNENSMYGPVSNPHDLSKVAGGSSGGSAAAVADNMCIYSIAEDTGGSIRQPASFCGASGFRPSYGRNSRFGIMPMASSLDTVGPITKTTYDAALVMSQIAGQDILDGTTLHDSVPNYLEKINEDLSGLRVGIPKEYFELEGLDSEVKEITAKQIDKLKELGCKVEEVSLPHTKYAIAVYYILVPCEDSSNLGRLDGIRYGVRQKGKDLYDLYAGSRATGFPEEVKRRILIGTYALSAGYYDAYYKKAQTVRTLIKRDFDEVFKKVDLLITPTSPFPAFGVGEKKDDPLALYMADVMVSPAAIAGVPALSVPSGKNSAGLPVGVQIIGSRYGEEKIFRVGSKLEIIN